LKYACLIIILTLLACEVEQIVLQTGESTVDYSFPSNYNNDPQYRTDADASDLFQISSVDSEGEFPIWALYLGDQSTIATDTILLYCHGNAASMNDYWWMLQYLANIGQRHQYGILCFDYRGFGNSEGSCSQESFTADTKAAVDWLMSHGVAEQRIVFFGNSLGALPATLFLQANSVFQDNKLILEAPFPGIDAFIQDGAGLSLPGSMVSNISGEKVEDLVKDLRGPLLWIHGKKDDTIPYPLGESIFNNCSATDKQSLLLEHAGHHDIIWKAGEAHYLEVLQEFIKS